MEAAEAKLRHSQIQAQEERKLREQAEQVAVVFARRFFTPRLQ
jgi:hypothetical protein